MPVSSTTDLVCFVRIMAAAMDAGNPYTHGRSYRCSRYAVCLGRRFGMAGPLLIHLELAGLLLDLGKRIALHNLHAQPASLTPEERAVMDQHLQISAAILDRFPTLRRAGTLIASMNERYDGRGTPEKLEGIAIPLGSRILAVVSALDAMLSDRPHRPALAAASVYLHLREEANRRFDSRIVEAAIKLHSSGDLARELDTRMSVLYVSGEVRSAAQTRGEAASRNETSYSARTPGTAGVGPAAQATVPAEDASAADEHASPSDESCVRNPGAPSEGEEQRSAA